MARAVISERKLSMKMEQISNLSLALTEELNQLAVTQPDSETYPNAIKQTQKLVQELIGLSH
jgi:hypothetical protein